MPSLVDHVDAILPQTQCTKCGYGGCRPYAQAIVDEGVAINRCPPGGVAGIRRLADLLGRDFIELDASCGNEAPLKRAVITEALCIGCTLCIDACPVDAIVGASRHMHSIIAAHCTGCELCVAPCPMDCITMEPVQPSREWTPDDARKARERMLARKRRKGEGEGEADDEVEGQHQTKAVPQQPIDRRAAIDAARARARSRRADSSVP